MGAPQQTGEGKLPFPASLCHSCAAPPRYVTSDRGSVFIYCPILKVYAAQPVIRCSAFVPKAGSGS